MERETSPYISISAVTDPNHIDPLLEQFNAQPLGDFGHEPVVSYLTHNGTPDGQPHPHPKFRPRTVDSIAHVVDLIHRVGDRAVNVLHIDCVDYEKSGNTLDAMHASEGHVLHYHPIAPVLPKTLAIPYADKTCRTVQINGHVTVEDLDALFQVMPELRVIMAIGPNIMQRGTQGMLEYIGERRQYMKEILLDASVGRGTVVRPGEVGEHIKTIAREFPGLGQGVAGGIAPETVGPIVTETRAVSGVDEISVDAESALRDDMNNLALPKTGLYIPNAAGGYRK